MKALNILLLSLFIICLSAFFSCEMKKELTGGIDKPSSETGGNTTLKDAGLLDLELKPQKEAEIPASKGGITGSEVVVLDVNDFAIDVLNESGEVVKHYDSYADLKNEGGLLLPAGLYSICATLGEEVNAGFDMPFYSGTNQCEVTSQEVAKVITECVLSNKKIAFRCSEGFLKNFSDDYSIVVDNGNGALTTFKDEKRTAFLKNTGVLQFAMYVTTKDGKKNLTYNYDLSKNENIDQYNNILVDLDIVSGSTPTDPEPGDPDEPSDPGNPDPSPDPDPKPDVPVKGPQIKVDISLIEKDYVIEIPSDFVDSEKPDPDPNPGEPENPGEAVKKPSIKGNGFDIDNPKMISIAKPKETVQIEISTPGYLASLQITITSSVLEPLLDQIGLGKSFDMCNLTATQKDILTGLELPIPDKGGTSTTFDISSFMPMIAAIASPDEDYIFTVKATDKAGQSATKTLTIRMTK